MNGLAGMIGQLGATLSGYNLGYTIDKLGWSNYPYIIFYSMVVLSISLVIPAYYELMLKDKVE